MASMSEFEKTKEIMRRAERTHQARDPRCGPVCCPTPADVEQARKEVEVEWR